MSETPRGADAGSIPDGTPEKRCGYTFDEEDFRPSIVACCWRKAWKEGRCIWHADVSNKPADELHENRTDHPEDLNGAVLRSTEVEGLQLSGCSLTRADITDADLAESDLSGTILIQADFTDANVKNTNFTDANLGLADLTKAGLFKADLTNAILRNTDLEDADLSFANLTDASLSEARLTNADLSYADLTNLDLADANLTGVNLEETVLSGTRLEGADLRNAELFKTSFDDVRIDSKTQFGPKNIYEKRADRNAYFPTLAMRWRVYRSNYQSSKQIFTDLRCARRSPGETETTGLRNRLYQKVVLPTRRFINWPTMKANDLESALQVYQNLQQLYRQNALPDKVPDFYVREYHSRRKLALAERRYRDWLWLAIQRRVMLYGESPRQVAKFSGYVILLWTALYLFTRGITVGTPSEDVQRVAPLLEWSGSLPSPLPKIGTSLYFSVVTFTTLGYGDVQPVGNVAKFLAGIEALVGAVLMALFVAVASQRVTR